MKTQPNKSLPTVSKLCCSVHGESLSEFPTFLLSPESPGNSTIVPVNKTSKNKIVSSMPHFCYSVKLIRQQAALHLSLALSAMGDLGHHGFQIINRWLNFQCHFQDWRYPNTELFTSDSGRICPPFYFQNSTNPDFSMNTSLDMAEICHRFSLQILQLLSNFKSYK